MDARHIRVKVFPQARKEMFEAMDDSTFQAFVREPAQKNMANRRVCALVAEHFAVDVRNVLLEAGHRGPIKTIRISNTH